MLRYACFLALFWNVNSASAPFIKPCKDRDNECIKKSAQDAIPFIAPGIPALGVKSFDPLKLPFISSNQSSLQLVFKDSTITGLKGCKIESIKHDMSKGKQTLIVRCNILLEGDYTLNGQILIFNAQGQGKYRIDIKDIVIKTVTDLTTVQGKDGKPHWKILKWRDTFQVKTGATFAFENLFNGNKVLAEPVTTFVNENWKDVMAEIAPSIVHTIVATVYEYVDFFYEKVAAEELSLK